VPPATYDPVAQLSILSRHAVAFVAIGGWAADVHGVVWDTWDLDIVIEATDENYAALLAALQELDAEFDTAHTPPIRPDLKRLSTATGALLFRTIHGRLDVMKEAGGETYATLGVDAAETTVGGHAVAVASLAAILRMKRAANRPKDRAVLPRIEAALRKASSNDE
jgi:hypothetical protein